MPDSFPEERLKKIIGNLLADKKLEYVDFRCYRIYPSFETYLKKCSDIDDDKKTIMLRNLHGDTLEKIGQDYGVTRERIRQIVLKVFKRVHKHCLLKMGMDYFEEDYYRYFYENYHMDPKEMGTWLSIPDCTWKYLQMLDIQRGEKDLNQALTDQNLNRGLRIQIRNYLFRNKIFLEGQWVEKKRVDLENLLLPVLAKDDISYDSFTEQFNHYLKEHGIPYNEDLYYTNEVERSRRNRLSEARLLLWKLLNETIRYYDIDANDYTELLETLNIEDYQNTELSTYIWIRDYPEIMKKYDIRDQYELHNLLRKILPDGSYHDFHCQRMPTVRFGEFDRDSAFLDILIDHAPISANDFVDLIYEGYGYEKDTIYGSFLKSFDIYYHMGIYSIDQKIMSLYNREMFDASLTEPLYLLDDLHKRYQKMFPDADPGELNPYTLKTMGFSVYSKAALRGYSNQESYFRHLFSSEDIVDVSRYKSRYSILPAYSSTYIEMQKNLDIVEFEPGKIINIRKLEKVGISKNILKDFCNKAYQYVLPGQFFTIQSLQKEGFCSELLEYGFSDLFYSSVLLSDARFGSEKIFGNLVFRRDNTEVTLNAFASRLIQEHQSIYTGILLKEMVEKYGCINADVYRMVGKLKTTNVYYDPILDKWYADRALYEHELEEEMGD